MDNNYSDMLVLKNDYDEEGLEAFKQEVLSQFGSRDRLPVIPALSEREDCPNPDCPCRQKNQ